VRGKLIWKPLETDRFSVAKFRWAFIALLVVWRAGGK
jgi:hypothetical protein